MTLEKLSLRILIKDVIRRMLVIQTKISIRGGPSFGLMSLMISKPRALEPKKTLIKIQLISARVKESRARSVKVVRKPATVSE